MSSNEANARMRVVGVGNPFRGDDGAGRAVARRLADRHAVGIEVVETEGGVADVLEAFENAQTLVVVDAVVSGSKAGTLHRFDAAAGRLPSETFRGSTHGLGVGEAVEIARALGRLPRSLVVYGIEGEDFTPGARLSHAVEIAVEKAVETILGDVRFSAEN